MPELEPPPIHDAPLTLAEEAEPQALVPLAGIPFPPLVKALAAFTTVAFLLALFRTPAAISNGVRDERGKQALAAGHFKEAAAQLQPLIDAYPTAEEARINLVRAYLGSDDLERAARNLSWFEGKEVTQEQEKELNEIGQQFASRIEAVEKQSK